MDYHSGPYNVTFPVRETCSLLNVPIVHDNVLEKDEKFILNINSSSLPSNIIAGNPDQATVTIEDDDGNCVILTIVNYVRMYLVV